ncbi:MAG: T3/T7 RNA polymerase, partial [Caedimonadaceae bacterium]
MNYFALFGLLLCAMQIKLSIAEQFANDVIYFPHNLDFRGRAYPVPPNLSHIGSDMCRALLRFNEAKPLGDNGLRWLKIHLSNLFGHNKVSFNDRVVWTESHMADIVDSARNPIEGKMWWSTAESPFQALAACIELANAHELSDPTTYKCSLPVHQDGSCNGLQHYAGLGRDELGGKAVNLVPFDTPQDVYSEVLHAVNKRVALDAERTDRQGHLARLVQPILSRKIIKQTVMTSVYGVTAIGARMQVLNRLQEHFAADGLVTPQREAELSEAAAYVAKMTLESLREMFRSAKLIMDWLGLISNMIAESGHTMSWITPLGLPVTQPYRRPARHAVNTVLQRVVLSLNSDFLPVACRKQRSAFPPNFVHSLDATHMLLTSLRMKEKGLCFASVHDSFWTHA